ncbi:MAG: hypothetical protein EKK47_22305 [Burkholderiales bacterium]|nr:MAG: hypothetical protein EKK47_22305 [Burkholderiales bacterium]
MPESSDRPSPVAFNVDFEAFESRFAELSQRPRLDGYPPRVFISYRRASQGHIDDAKRIADQLRGLNYNVLFDEDEVQQSESPDVSVAHYIARTAEAHVFAMLVHDEYLSEDLQVTRRWLFEEQQKMRLLYAAGRAKATVIWMCSADPPQPGQSDWAFKGVDVIDLRDRDWNRLAQFFPKYEGFELNEHEETKLIELLETIDSAALDDLPMLKGTLLNDHPQSWLAIPEFLLALLRFALAEGKLDMVRDGIKTEILPRLDVRLSPPIRYRAVCLLFEIDHSDDYHRVIEYGSPLLRFNRASWLPRIHHIVGHAFDGLSSPLSAVNHLRFSSLVGRSRAGADWSARQLESAACILINHWFVEAALVLLKAAQTEHPNNAHLAYSTARALSLLGHLRDAVELQNAWIEKSKEFLNLIINRGSAVQTPADHKRLKKLPPTDRVCMHCQSEFRLGAVGAAVICAGCGSVRDRSQSLCVYCCSDKIDIATLRKGVSHPLCPICFNGDLATAPAPSSALCTLLTHATTWCAAAMGRHR